MKRNITKASVVLFSSMMLMSSPALAQESEDTNNNEDPIGIENIDDEENQSDSFSYIDLYDPNSRNFVSPPAYPIVDYYTLHKPDPLKVTDVGIAPPVYPIPTIDN